jgi:hypothetical protein
MFFIGKKEHTITQIRQWCCAFFVDAMEEHPKIYTSGFNGRSPSSCKERAPYNLQLFITVVARVIVVVVPVAR